MRLLYLIFIFFYLSSTSLRAEILRSWNEGENRQNIINYVETIIDEKSSNFIPVEERIAVFDNDGTLWSEFPVYTQIFFAIDRLKILAKTDTEIAASSAYKALEENNFELFAKDKKAAAYLIAKTHTGMEVGDFIKLAQQWITTHEHPKKKKIFSSMTFVPMIELMNYLRENDFEVYIVSGGGIHFIRSISQELYDVPPQKVIGTMLGLEHKIIDGKPVVMRTPALHSYDDHEGKVLNIVRNIGRKPIFAAGNSDGDFEMLEYTTTQNKHLSFGLIVHHTDEAREFAYDRKSIVGSLNRGLDEYQTRGWALIDMKNDWKQVYGE